MPPAFRPLLEAVRYKGAWGGRGSGKSHFFAEMLIARCSEARVDAVCVREIQRSLAQSVKKLLETKIVEMGVSESFTVLQTHIESVRGGIITFQGMQNHTADSIKSLEGYDIAWVEEAQSLSQRSLDLLRPTIRKADSELWFSWNPNDPGDPVDQLLRGPSPPPDVVVVQANYRDNPWLPEVLEAELAYDQRRDPDKYAHVWLGGYQSRSEARVFKNWTVEEFERPPGTVHRLGADWGYSVDPTVLVRCDIERNRLYVDHEAYMVGCEIVQTPDLFDAVPDARKWFITADAARPETISFMRSRGFRINAAIKGARSIEEGVAFLQSFDIIVHPRCVHVIDELSCYSYKSDPLTGKVLPILQDKKNHCIAEGALVACLHGDIPIEQVTTADLVLTRGGYRRVLFAGLTDVDRETRVIGTSGGTVCCTPDHEIWTAKGFVRADALRYDDEVIIAEAVSWSSALFGMVSSIAAIPIASMNRVAATFSAATVAALHCFIGMYGRFTTAPSPQGLRSITSTVTAETTTSQTLSCSHALHTSQRILGVLTARNGSGQCLTASGHSRKHGTPAKRDGPNIERLAGWPTSVSIQKRSGAPFAGHGSSPASLEASISTAPTPASQRRVAPRAWMTRYASALRAALHSLQISTGRKRLARGRVETLSAGERCARVYDLTVEEHHEFFANGVLVSNCIDALRYACEGARREAKAREEDAPPRQRDYDPAVAGVGM